MSSRLSGSWDRIGSQRTSFRDGEPDVVSRGLVVARRVANESLELGQRPILDAAIDIEDAHQTPLPEGPAGFPKGENFRSVTDPGSADGAMAGAMEESQRTPPSKASTRSQTMVKRPMEPSARSARDLSRFLRDFIGLDDPDNRGTGDMVQQSAAECNEKVKGDRQDNFAAQSGGHDGEGYREGEKWAKA